VLKQKNNKNLIDYLAKLVKKLSDETGYWMHIFSFQGNYDWQRLRKNIGKRQDSIIEGILKLKFKIQNADTYFRKKKLKETKAKMAIFSFNWGLQLGEGMYLAQKAPKRKMTMLK